MNFLYLSNLKYEMVKIMFKRYSKREGMNVMWDVMWDEFFEKKKVLSL